MTVQFGDTRFGLGMRENSDGRRKCPEHQESLAPVAVSAGFIVPKLTVQHEGGSPPVGSYSIQIASSFEFGACVLSKLNWILFRDIRCACAQSIARLADLSRIAPFDLSRSQLKQNEIISRCDKISWDSGV